MKLRELINRLEQISHRGQNDDLDVEIWNSLGENNMIQGNHISEPINKVWIDTYITPNDEYNYVLIEI